MAIDIHLYKITTTIELQVIEVMIILNQHHHILMSQYHRKHTILRIVYLKVVIIITIVTDLIKQHILNQRVVLQIIHIMLTQNQH